MTLILGKERWNSWDAIWDDNPVYWSFIVISRKWCVNEVEEWITRFFSVKIKIHRRIFSKMDKMNKNEFYNRINSKFLYLFEVKFPHLSLKTVFFLKIIAKWSQNSSARGSKNSILGMNSIMNFIFAVLYAV